ncbi:MAG TPA: hypothetical protein VEK79_00800 [Thermoanaerobaculia bacterium]|nr:hypothetical protein [Thermoanaerobaculia bacterium]
MHLLLVLALAFPPAESATLQCAHEVAAAVGDEVWPGWSAAPFSTLLVAGETEYLVTKASNAKGFETGDAAPVAGYKLFHRKRTFSPNFLATFPISSPEPVIVVGTPAKTGKSEAAWLVTLLHEHFHQLQYSQPWYYERTAALNLSKGDTTGMWMLNYAFPYADPAVQQRFERFSHALAKAVRARGTVAFTPALREVKSTWRELRDNLTADDYAYLRLQLWQEGIPRYAELMLASKASTVACVAKVQPSMSVVAEETLAGILRSLDNPKLGERQREVVYATGAAIALLLDETSPSWKVDYFAKPFALESYFAP